MSMGLSKVNNCEETEKGIQVGLNHRDALSPFRLQP